MKTKRYVKAWLKTFGEVSPDHFDFSIALIRKLAAEGPVSLTDMETQLDIKMRRLKNFVKKRPTTEFNDDHKIVGHGPVSLVEKPQQLELQDKKIYAPTPWDVLTGVFYLGQSVLWKGKCELTQSEFEVKVMPEGIETEQEGIYISFMHPDEIIAENLDTIQQWCVPLVKDDTVDQYLEKHPTRVAIPLSQAFQFARDVFDTWAFQE